VPLKRLRNGAVDVALWGDRRFRALTASRRALPDFLIIGTQKGGTTSLYHYLSQHPDVLKAYRKEVHYFDSYRYHRGPLEYRAMFPLQASLDRRAKRGRPAITGEATPSYLWYPTAPERVAALVPHAKLVVLLRDPRSRAFSQYRQNVRWNVEPLSFGEALDAERDRLRAPLEQVMAGVDGDRGTPLYRYSYATRGHYADQLDRWHRHFPAEQFLILRSVDFLRDPEAGYREVCRFLGVPEVLPAQFDVRNAQGSAPPLDDDVRNRLTEVFEDDLDRLAADYGVDLRS
jgi:hypothetical protein